MNKIICGIIPCKDRFFLDKALSVIKPGVEEIVAMTAGEDTYYKVASELYAGIKQLEMIYLDDEDVPDDKEQATVIGKLLKEPSKDYVGFGILELWANSLHVYQAYLLPQYRGVHFLQQAYANLEKQARLLGAPYISVCTKRAPEVARFGFVETYTTYRKKL